MNGLGALGLNVDTIKTARKLVEIRKAADAGKVYDAGSVSEIYETVGVDPDLARDPTTQAVAEAMYQRTLTGSDLTDYLAKQRRVQQLERARDVRNRAVKVGWHKPVLTSPLYGPHIEALRKATLAGDWDRVFDYLPPLFWGNPDGRDRAIQLGKFNFVRGGSADYPKAIFKPFTDAQIRGFFHSTFVRTAPFGYVCTQDQREDHTKTYIARQRDVARQYPPSDWRHVVQIYPGAVLCERPRKSLWVMLRTPIVVAVGAIALAYLGPIVYDKIAGKLASLAGAQTGPESAALLAKIKRGGSAVLEHVNQPRTIDAIVQGGLPPPPVSIGGKSFTEWALDRAKKEIAEQAKEKAAELGTEYIQKKLTERQERKLREEIQAMQRELAALTANVPKSPDPAVPAPVQRESAKLAETEKKRQDWTLAIAAVGLPLLWVLSGG